MNRHQNSDKIQELGCSMLADVANGGPDARTEIIHAGGCGAIVNAMEAHQTDSSVQIAAFGALKVLSQDFQCWFELERHGHMPIIHQTYAMHFGSAVLEREGAAILMNFSAHSTE